jgi:cell division protein FtsZ
MVFIAAGFGGGTGTGAAPVIAETCLEAGLLTVGVVTKPFRFEGLHRMRLAEEGLRRLQVREFVGVLVVCLLWGMEYRCLGRQTFRGSYSSTAVIHPAGRGGEVGVG